MSAIATAAPPLASIKIAEASPPVEVVRCHFAEGRIVIRHADKLHVLRAGDELDSIGLHLLEITPESAILTVKRNTPTASLRIIKIARTDSGTVQIREFATDPTVLPTGSTKSSPQATTSSLATDTPKLSPNGD